MKKYIELDSAVNEIERFNGYLDDDMILRLQIALQKISTADAVPVVRCKNCSRQCICYHSADYYCADGKKR